MNLNLDAIRSARNTIIARGWHPGTCAIPSVSTVLGAQEEHGPVSMISSLAHVPGAEFHPIYQALRFVTRPAPSLTVWEGSPGRTQADVLGAFDFVIQMLTKGVQ